MVWRSLVVFLVACGGSSNHGGDVTAFIGVYATTSHTRAEVFGSRVKCADAAPPVTNPTPYFRLDVDSFSMDPDELTVSNCSDAAGMTCTETIVSLRAGGPGLQDEHANTQTDGPFMCQLYFTHSEATLAGATVQVETLDKFDAPNISSSECTLPRARDLASSPDCRSVERWAGTRQ
jgi:hypothetical protein